MSNKNIVRLTVPYNFIVNLFRDINFIFIFMNLIKLKI